MQTKMIVKKAIKKPNQNRVWILRGAGLLIAAYGVYTFGKRDIGTYMLMQRHDL